MQLTELIKKFPESAYTFKNPGVNSNFEFHDFTFFTDPSIIAAINNCAKDEIIKLSGTYENGADVTWQFIEPDQCLESLTISVQDEVFCTYLLERNSLDKSKVKIHPIFDQAKYEGFTLKMLDPHKRNVIIFPFLPKEIKNEYFLITNNEAFNFPDDSDISELLNNVRKISTILNEEFFLPDMLYFARDDYSYCPESIRTGFLKNALLSLLSHSHFSDGEYDCGIKGYKTISFFLTDSKILEIFNTANESDLYKLYHWVFGESKIADIRIQIVRNLLTLDASDENDIFKLISDPTNLLNSAKHQFDLVINGSIKEHFENLEKVVDRVTTVAEEVNSQVDKLTGILTQTLLGGFGFVLSTLASTENIPSLFKLIIAVIFLFFLFFQHDNVQHNLKARKEQIFDQFDSYKDILIKKLKVISEELISEQIDGPIQQTQERFTRIYNVVYYTSCTAIISTIIATLYILKDLAL